MRSGAEGSSEGRLRQGLNQSGVRGGDEALADLIAERVLLGLRGERREAPKLIDASEVARILGCERPSSTSTRASSEW